MISDILYSVLFAPILSWVLNGVVTSFVIADVDNGSDECDILMRSKIYACDVRFDSRLIWIYFLYHYIFHLIGLCLGYVPAFANGSCRVSEQGTTLCVSYLHNARATILNPYSKWYWNIYIYMHTIKIQINEVCCSMSCFQICSWFTYQVISELKPRNKLTQQKFFMIFF